MRKKQEEQHNIEKQEWLAKLDKITNNYKVYAETYQHYVVLNEENENMRRELNDIKQITKHYETLVKITLSDLVSDYKKVNFYLISEKLNASTELSFDYWKRAREEIKDKLSGFNEKIDPYVFEDIYNEVKKTN